MAILFQLPLIQSSRQRRHRARFTLEQCAINGLIPKILAGGGGVGPPLAPARQFNGPRGIRLVDKNHDGFWGCLIPVGRHQDTGCKILCGCHTAANPHHSGTDEAGVVSQGPHELGGTKGPVLHEGTIEFAGGPAHAVALAVVEVDQSVFVVTLSEGSPPLPGTGIGDGEVAVHDTCHVEGSLHAQVATAAAANLVVAFQDAVLALQEFQRGIDRLHGSNAQEEFLPIHPPHDQRQNDQHHAALQDRRVDRAKTREDLRAEIPFEIVPNKAAH